MIKVVVYIDSCRVGGMHQQMLYLLQGLDPNLFDTYLIVQHKSGGLLAHFEGCTKVIDLQWKSVTSSIRVLFNLVKQLSKIKPDILLITEAQNFIYFLMARPFLVSCTPKLVGSFRALTFWNGHLSPARMKMDNFVSKLLVHSSRAIVVNSCAMYERYTALLNSTDKFLLIPNCLSDRYSNPRFSSAVLEGLHPTFSDAVKNDCKIIIMVARLDPWKDFDTLFKAAVDVLAFDHNVRFFLIGNGVLYESLKFNIQEKSLDKFVHLLGECDPYGYYMHSHISVLSTYGEGFSNSLMESMAIGLPTIATRVGGNVELLALPECLAEPQNSADLSNKIINLLSHPQLIERMSKELRARVVNMCSPVTYIASFQKLFIRLYYDK